MYDNDFTKRINNSIITNFEDLNAEMPKLEFIDLSNCHIHNFRGIPSVSLSVKNSTIDSFEGLQLSVPHNFEESRIHLRNCTIHSLGGISHSTIHAILIAILSMDFREYIFSDNIKFEDREFHQNKLHQIKLDLPPTALKLIQESIDPEIERRYSPKYCQNLSSIMHEWQLQNYGDTEDWIYGFNLMERLFIPEKLDQLHEYYRKTTREIAQEYISDPSGMDPEQIERLVHEVDPEIRKLLENNLPPNNPLIKQISDKFAFKTENGLKFFK